MTLPWVSRPDAILGAGLCWELSVHCVSKLLQLLERAFFVHNLHRDKGKRVGEPLKMSPH